MPDLCVLFHKEKHYSLIFGLLEEFSVTLWEGCMKYRRFAHYLFYYGLKADDYRCYNLKT